jgi:hypothetical protein
MHYPFQFNEFVEESPQEDAFYNFGFMELNWGAGATRGASESISLFQEAGYSFAKPGKRLYRRKSGVWLRALTDVVARRTHQTRVS